MQSSSYMKIIRFLLRRFVPVAVAGLAAVPLPGQVTVKSNPVGVLSAQVNRGGAGLAFPLIAEDLFVGIVSANTGTALTFAPGDGNLGALLAAEGRYYVEVVTGALEGERFDLDAAATVAAAGPTLALGFGGNTFSTLPTLASDALVGARCVLRPHATLAGVQAMFSPALRGHNLFLIADGVHILEANALRFYFLRGDNATWNAVGSSSDQRNKVIPPDASVILDLKSGPKQWLQQGVVRANAFRKNLKSGLQSFASGYPQDTSPVDLGAFVDVGTPVANRWTGSNLFLFADQFDVLFSDRKAIQLYYLRGDGTSWRSLRSSANFANQTIVGATDMVVVRRLRPDPNYLILRPYDL